MRVSNAASCVLDEWPDPQVQSWVTNQANRFANKLDTLSASSRSDGRSHRAKLNDVLTSPASTFSCLMLGVWRRDHRLTYVDAIQIADQISVRQDCGEIIRLRPQPKPDGGVRMGFAYGLKRTSLQFLVKFALEATLDPNPFDFSGRGLGAPRAIEKILQLIGKEDRPWLYTSDIRDCFLSIKNGDWITSVLGLPRAVVDNVIFNPPHNSHHLTSVQAAPLGLPAGALTSNLVASTMLRPVVEDMASHAVLSYADNFASACSDEAEAIAIHEALRKRLQILPGGPLELHDERYRHVRKGGHWLGYDLKVDQSTGKVRATPTAAAFVRFVERLGETLQGVETRQLDNVALRYAQQWNAAMPVWEPLNPATELTFSGLEELALEVALREWEGRKAKAAGLPVPSASLDEFWLPQ